MTMQIQDIHLFISVGQFFSNPGPVETQESVKIKWTPDDSIKSLFLTLS